MDDAIHERFQSTDPGAPTLGADEIHVWVVPLVGEGAAFTPLLSAAERDQAERFRFVDHRRRYAISHGALRAILAGYLAVDPVDLQFSTGRNRKPELENCDAGVHFNLSHSGQLALIAVGKVAVGIDLEKMRHLESLRDIARHNFSTDEIAALERCSDADRLVSFYRCWTRKEAYVKALGTGLSTPLDIFDVSIEDDAAFVGFRDGQDLRDWGLWDVSPTADYVAALAARSARARLLTFRLTGL